MKFLLLLQFLVCLASRVAGKVYGRCELARVLKEAGLEGYRGHPLADWLCMAFYESRFNTSLVQHEFDGTTSNGIFQINSRFWCEDYKQFQPNKCQIHCSDLLTSSIRDDIICAMRIAQGPRGLGAWEAGKSGPDYFCVWSDHSGRAECPFASRGVGVNIVQDVT